MSSSSSNDDSQMSVFEVQEIVGSKMVGNELHYKVRWKNYGASADTYEPASNLQDCAELLAAYEAKQNSQKKKTPANNPRGKNARRSRDSNEKMKNSTADSLKVGDSGSVGQNVDVLPSSHKGKAPTTSSVETEKSKTSNLLSLKQPPATEVEKAASLTSEKSSVDLDKDVRQKRKRKAAPLKELSSTDESEVKTSESDEEPQSKSTRRKGPVRQRRIQSRPTSSKSTQDQTVQRQCKTRISYAEMDSVSSLIEASSSDEGFKLKSGKSKSLIPTRLSSTPVSTSKLESKKTNFENVDKGSPSVEVSKCAPSSSVQLTHEGEVTLISAETEAQEAGSHLIIENGTKETAGLQLFTLPMDKHPKPPDTVITVESSQTPSESSIAHIIDAEHLQKSLKKKNSLGESTEDTDVCAAFGRYVGSSLGTMSNLIEREVVMKKIQDLLYESKIKVLKQK